MPNIYYCHAVNRRGTLRAVLSSEEGRLLLKEYPAQYVGQDFPTEGHGSGIDFAVLSIFEGEVIGEYGVGYYLFDQDIMRIEEAIQSCTSRLVR